MGGEITGQPRGRPRVDAEVRGAPGRSRGPTSRATPGRSPASRTIRGLVSGRVDLSGLGADLHTLQGGGEAHVTEGDLGKLPLWAPADQAS